MSKLELSLACGDYEIVRALKDGRVHPDGIELRVLTADRTRILKSKRRDECDLAEFNIVGYLMDSQSDPGIVALPVFPHRRFRHGFVFTSTSAGIGAPADLAGKKVGILGERPAAAVWVRGILAEHYGLDLAAVDWLDAYGVLGRVPEGSSEERLVGQSARLEAELLEGGLAAVVAPSFPQAFLRSDPRIGRLFPDYKAEEVDYYHRCGIFPIMHAVVAKRAVLERHPWVAASMARAFEEAKRLAYETVRNPRVLPLAFFESAWEEQVALLGRDPWQYGLSEQNRRNLETIVRYSAEQGLLDGERRLEELFVPLDDSAFVGTPGF